MNKQTIREPNATKSITPLAGVGYLLLTASSLLFVASSGCGTAQYEQRMDERIRQLRQSSPAERPSTSADNQDDSLDEEEEF